MRSVFLVAIIGLMLSNVSAQDSKNMSLIMLFPNQIYDGDANFFALDVQNQQVDGVVNLTIFGRSLPKRVQYRKSFPIRKSKGTLFNLDVSDIELDRPERDYSYDVVLDGQFGGTIFQRNGSIAIRSEQPLILIQTDKKIYKPGQKVFVRVMVLDYSLRPLNKGQLNVSISDPHKNYYANWKNVNFTGMVMQFDIDLGEEPAEGTWAVAVTYEHKSLDRIKEKISFSKNMVDFTVTQYTLPKFKVTITPPPYILFDDKKASYKICANYSFGKPVTGKLSIRFFTLPYQWSLISEPQEPFEDTINGCYNFVVNISSSDGRDMFVNPGIQLIANVIESGTGIQMNATDTSYKTSAKWKLKFLQKGAAKYFRPYMKTPGSLKVSTPNDFPLGNETFELCLTSTSKIYSDRYRRTDVRIMCKNYTTDVDGIIKFTLPPFNSDVVSLKVEAKSNLNSTTNNSANGGHIVRNSPRASSSYKAFFSPSKQYIQFERLGSEKLPCDKPVRLSAYYTFDNEEKSLEFRYVVMARSRNIISKNIVVKRPTRVVLPSDDSTLLFESISTNFSDIAFNSEKKVGRLDIEIDPQSSELPQLTVALFYVTGNEVVADNIRVARKVCTENKVDVSFSQRVVQPGAPINMTISASAQSQCAFEIIDRAFVLFSGTENNPFLKYRDDLPNREVSAMEYWPDDIFGQCFDCGRSNDYVDSKSVFVPEGWSVITYNVELETRPRGNNDDEKPDRPLGFSSRFGDDRLFDGAESTSVGQQNFVQFEPAPRAKETIDIDDDFGDNTATASNSVVEVRDYFPEMWLFEVGAVDENGKLHKSLTAPHQSTVWNANAACLHPTKGLGVSKSKQIKTYQAFFTEINLPYSVKRGENLPIVISVFNYLPHCMPILIKIDPIAGLEVKTSLSKEVCICPETSPFQYELRVAILKTAKIGNVNVTVTVVNSNNVNVCANQANTKIVQSRDKISRQLKVIPEGFMVENVNSHLLCPNEGNINMDLELPKNAINGSSRSIFSISGDVMGQAVANHDNLIVLPTGCGEQNMAKFMINLAVLQYLKSTNQLESSIENRILNNIRSGYQNQLKFRQSGGGYSVWSSPISIRSSLLTAMVYQGFNMAKSYIFIADDKQAETLDFILRTQSPLTGCYESSGSIYSSALKDSVDKRKNLGAYTAYVLAAIRGSLASKSSIGAAFRCVTAQKNMNQYEYALSAYAAALYDQKTLAKRYLNSLKAFENRKIPNQKFYHPSDDWSPQLIETSAYAILAQLTLDTSVTTLQEVQPIVRWLIKKQNRNGGYYTSQDTVIALQAITIFAKLVHKDLAAINNNVTVVGDDFKRSYSITKSNAAIWYTDVIKTIPNHLTLSSSGRGCVVVSSQLRYNVPSIFGESGFTFNVSVSKDSTVESITLELCVSYNLPGNGGSNMAIIELTPLSGYTAVRSTLEILKARYMLNDFDISGSPIILYFNEFEAIPRCLSIDLKQVYEVTNLQPASAVVYDYYEKDKRKSVEYERGNLPSNKVNSDKVH